MEDHLADVIRQFIKIVFLHSESRHLLDPHSQATGRGKSLIIRCALIIDDDIVLFEPIGYFRAFRIAHPDDYLVRLRVPEGRVSFDSQPPINAPRNDFGVTNSLGWKF